MIPAITDPLGRHWEQPDDIRSAPMDDTHVILTPWQFSGLHEYSATIPTGVYNGKCWKAKYRGRWLLRWYGDAPGRPDLCAIESREILVVGGAA